jgi:hypothetical protein
MQEDQKIEEYIRNFEKIEENDWKTKLIVFLENRYFFVAVIILMAVISFCLGRISGVGEKREPVRVLNNSSNNPYITDEVKGVFTSTSNPPPGLEEGSSATAESGSIVASKNGTKYHYPWCAGAKQISEKNKIIFNSIEEARTAGYTPASNCKGLK